MATVTLTLKPWLTPNYALVETPPRALASLSPPVTE